MKKQKNQSEKFFELTDLLSELLTERIQDLEGVKMYAQARHAYSYYRDILHEAIDIIRKIEKNKGINNIVNDKLSMTNIKEAARNALNKTRKSNGMKTCNISERELELSEIAFINGAIWAKNTIEQNGN